jgi:hypothetical protein
MAGRVLVHVGTHKTGTTSIQGFLRDEEDGLLASVGGHYPPGFLLPTVHTDLPLLTIRPERTWPARLRFPETQRGSWQAAARAHVRRQVVEADADLLVYVHEDLSYLRFDDELERLAELFAGRAVSVVAVLRDDDAFLRSYRSQLAGTGFATSDDPTSFAYVEPDSWLLDHEALLDGYRRWFGADHVTVLDYDHLVAVDGTVIPAYAELLGLDRAALPPLDRYHYNASGSHIRLSDDELRAIRRDLASRYP